MPYSIIIILTAFFIFALLCHHFLKKKFPAINEWVKTNMLLLVLGIIAAAVVTPFIIPHKFSRNLPVLTVIPVITYNVFYLVDKWAASFNSGKITRMIAGFFSILAGVMIGSQMVNFIGLSSFRSGDIKDVLLVAFFFNTVRITLDYASLTAKLLTKDKDLKLVQLREATTKVKLDMLHSKLNPHFLYNSLNSIAGLALVDGKKTKQMSLALSRLLRYSLNYSEDNFASVIEEAEIVQSYIDIEKIRFDTDLKYECSIEKGVEDLLVPRFLLQPLVENCIKHGFKVSGSGFISIGFKVSNNELVITILDNGLPFPENLIPGYGLKNVSDKLELLLSGKHSFQITNVPEKQIIITIYELKRRHG